MTNPPPAGTMQDARLVETEILLPKPKRFVREALVMPDGYECDWYYVDTPPSVMVVPVTAGRTLVAPVTAPRGARHGSAFALVITPLAGSGPVFAARVETQGQNTVVSIIPAASALTTSTLPPVRDSYDAVSP
jgi:hypothetical protein